MKKREKMGGNGTSDPTIRIVTCIHIHSMRRSCRGREKGGTGRGGGTDNSDLSISIYSGIVKLWKYTVVVHVGLANNPPHSRQSTFFKTFSGKNLLFFLDPHRSACIDCRCPYLLFLVNINTYIVRSSWLIQYE